MQRIRRHRDAELIGHAYSLLPPRLAQRLEHTHFLTGVDPNFTGLHHDERTVDGRYYRDTAHVVYPFHQWHRPAAERVTTVVIPHWTRRLQWWMPASVVHELGHVLDWQLGFTHHAQPVSEYAHTDRMEAFAEAFAAWALPFGYDYGEQKDRLYDTDRATIALLEGLVG